MKNYKKRIKMTSIVMLFFTAMLLTSCAEYHSWRVDSSTYSLSSVIIVPDSLKSEQAKWIIEACESLTKSSTFSDYDDVDDVMDEVCNKSILIFGRSKPCLKVHHHDSDYECIPLNRLTREQKIIYDKLLHEEQDSSIE